MSLFLHRHVSLNVETIKLHVDIPLFCLPAYQLIPTHMPSWLIDSNAQLSHFRVVRISLKRRSVLLRIKS
ncbi:hypothetical protein L596_020303 [Steinernema carpocapsae]|uniref:Uncharacterized protein n=1 Tax=Steinernema carpocapsae TaxID=34508 RepID=A0A4U5MT39_STECR|nr:hypothetical protein L596_020303 [Steinernema carpocapsae]